MKNLSFKHRIHPFLTIIILLHIAILPIYSQVVIIKDSVADLRTHPIERKEELKYPVFYPNNPKQDSQLLLGEPVYVLQEKVINNQEWLQVYALEQIKYSNGKLDFQAGWLKKSQTLPIKHYYPKNLVVNKNNTTIYYKKKETTVSIGTKLYGIPTNKKKIIVFNEQGLLGKVKTENVNIITLDLNTNIRDDIINVAKNFFGTPYSWGGRSGFDSRMPNQQTGVDCSGFINLVYRICGFQIPRDTHDQDLFCEKLQSSNNLKKGDLIFSSSSKKPKRISHVMLYLGDNKIQESIGVMMLSNIQQNKCYANRITTIEKKFGVPLRNLKSGKQYKNKYVYFGSVLNSQEKKSIMRNNFLGKNLIFK